MTLETIRSKINIHRLLIQSATNRKIKEKDIGVYKSYEGHLYEIRDVKLIKTSEGRYQIIIE